MPRHHDTGFTKDSSIASRQARSLGPVHVNLFLTFVTAGCEKEQKAEAAPPDVEVADVTQKDVPITREWVATLTGFVNAQIRAQVSGYIVKQLYTNGAYVKKGTPLFQLDARTFQASLDQATGNLAQAKADLQKAEAQLGKTQLDVDRYAPLAKQGAISQQELDDAVQANLAAKGQVAAAGAAIAAAEAAAESARLNLGYATIVSPVDGVAGISSAQVGDFVGPQSPILPGRFIRAAHYAHKSARRLLSGSNPNCNMNRPL